MIKKLSLIAVLCSLCVSQACIAADTYVSGQITSLMAHGTDPAIRLSNGNAVPTKCDGGYYGWLYFQRSAEKRQRVYAIALALSNKVAVIEPITD